MDNFFAKIASEIPSLAVLVFVVLSFLKHMEKRDKVIKEIHEEHMQARTEARIAINDNTTASHANTLAVQKLSSAVDAILKPKPDRGC